MRLEGDREPRATEQKAAARVPGWARGLLCAGLTGICAALCLVGAPRTSLPVGEKVPDFILTAEDGLPFDSKSLAGKVWVASFIFTRCRDTCPGMSGNMLLVEDAVKADPRLAASVRLVSFSVDPERDKPSDLKAYAASYGADPALWRFLTGEPGAVARLSEEGFRLPLGKAPLRAAPGPAPGAGPEIIHSDRFALVDRSGRLRGFYRPEAGDLQRLVAALRALVGEAAPAR